MTLNSIIQGGPKVDIQYTVYKLLYTYFWHTLFNKFMDNKDKGTVHHITCHEGQKEKHKYCSTLSST